MKKKKRLRLPNYTQIPNSLLGSMADYSDAELRVLLAVCRQTFGYHRRFAPMTVSMAAEMTGLSRNHANRALISLCDASVLKRREAGKTFIYRIHFEKNPSDATE